MKRYTNPVIDIEIYTDHPIFHIDLEEAIASKINASNYGLSDRPVIAKDKKRVEQWMIDDFEAFAERVEDLCSEFLSDTEYNQFITGFLVAAEDDYSLTLVYKDIGNDPSYYHNFLAKKASDGNVIVKFRLRLRISNHPAHSTKQQKFNKKAELQSEKLKQMLTDDQIVKLRSYPVIVTVNDEEYDSYDAAFEDVEKLLSRAVEVMSKR